MFRLNESVEMNTKKLCNLNESSDKSAKSLQARRENTITKRPTPCCQLLSRSRRRSPTYNVQHINLKVSLCVISGGGPYQYTGYLYKNTND